MTFKPGRSWSAWAREIEEFLEREGIERWPHCGRIRQVITYPSTTHYQDYARRCREHLWEDRDDIKIVEFGAGYGGMMPFWPENAKVTNIDLPVLLRIQDHWLGKQGCRDRAELVDIADLAKVDFQDVFFFSAFGLTETTLETWAWCMEEVFPKCAGIFLMGDRRWEFDDIEWPWSQLRELFEPKADQAIDGIRREFIGLRDAKLRGSVGQSASGGAGADAEPRRRTANVQPPTTAKATGKRRDRRTSS